MAKPRVRIYTDYKSPYAFVANKRLFELEEKHGVELEWLPYTLRIPEFMGTVEERTPHFWRKVRYAYMDARRYANAQGLTMKGTAANFDAFPFQAGMRARGHSALPRHGVQALLGRLNRRVSDISGVIAEASARRRISKHVTARHGEHNRIIDEAEALGVFGVPMASTANCSGAATASTC
jgi:2-hydroxychromene-2-carboxylate isomerase